ncbi:hypothetical protein [uncultured Eubacterium sp.]|uniref:hypothetical protein n=1 Tax=uncultured Eubacterium sp. TaxID=165185 RepID=UPI0025E97CB1|nr:hypothetical protein [uncultured Eubacterium sp.]
MKRSKVITIIISVIIVICLLVAVTFAVKSVNGKKSANENNTSDTVTVTETESNPNALSVGEPLYLDEKQSVNPNAVEGIEIVDDKVTLYNKDLPDFNGVVTNTEHISGDDFFDYCNSFDLTDISPIDFTLYQDIKIDSIAEENADADCKYKVYYLDNEPSLLGFVYKGNDGKDMVWCISDIENPAVYKAALISKDKATKIALQKHKELYPDLNSSFEEAVLKGAAVQYYAFNTIYNPNPCGHKYYGVSYFDNDSVADHYYYCVDAVTGDLIFNSIMGD